MRVGYKTLLHFSSQILVSITGFLATFAIINLGGTSLLGEYSTALALGYFWLVLPTTAINSGVKKRISEGTDQAAFFGVGFVLNAAVGLLVLVVVASLAVAVRLFPSVTIAGQTITIGGTVFARIVTTHGPIVAGISLASIAFWSVINGIEGRKRLGTTGLLEALERTTRAGVQIAVLLAGFGLATLMLGPVLSLAGGALIGLIVTDIRPRFPDREHIHSVLEYVRYAWLGTLRTRVYGWLDTLVLSLFVGASFIGIYEAAWGIASLLSVLSFSIKRTMFPEVSDWATDGRIDRIRHFLDESLLFGGLFIVPGIAGALVIGQRILQFYDPGITRGAGILVILVFAAAVDVYATQFLNVVNAVDRPDIAYRVNAVFIGVSVTLNLVLVWRFGWYGAAVATAVASATRTILGYQGAISALGDVSVPTMEMAKQVGAATLMAVFVYGVNGTTPHGRLWTLLLVGSGATVYLVVLTAVSNRVRQKIQSVVPVA